MKNVKRGLALLLTLAVAVSGNWLTAVPAMADDADVDYLYGYVNMNYADYYYGELENIVPDGKTQVTALASDKVTDAGYREEGYYDAATFATPGSFIYEAKWKTWPGTYSEPIVNEFGIEEGGRILGVSDVAVAVDKKLYDAAMADKNATILQEKLSEIQWCEDQSIVPLSYKVLNSDAVYTKWINAGTEDRELTGGLHAEYMGDDNWWEGKGLSVDRSQTIIGGFVEWTDVKGVNHREGLKQEENIYSTTWIGWGVGPNGQGIYGGNEVGWQRFKTMAGATMTKLSLMVLNEDGSVTYIDGDCGEEGMVSPWLLNGIIEEDGSMPYDVVLTNYEYQKDRVIIDFTFDVPVINGEPEADVALYSFNIPNVETRSLSYPRPEDEAKAAVYDSLVLVADESEWVNGHKTLHLELDREKFGTGRFKYWSRNKSVQEGGRTFGTIARWANIKTGLTMNEVYIKNNKLVVNSDIFDVEDYRLNPYQKVVITGPSGEDVVFTTGDSNSKNNIMTTLLKEDGTFDMNAVYVYTTGRGENMVTHEDPMFAEGADVPYTITMYCGGFPIVRGDLNVAQDQQITAENVTKTYGDKAFSLGATAMTKMTYTTSDKNVCTVSSKGKVTIKGAGIATITIKAQATSSYNAATKKVTITVNPGKVTLSSLKSSKAKTLDVTWKKRAEATGYEVQYATSSKFKSAKTVKIKKVATVKTTLKKLTAGKKYYVRVRAYKTSGKKTLYGAYSASKNLKVKK